MKTRLEKIVARLKCIEDEISRDKAEIDALFIPRTEQDMFQCIPLQWKKNKTLKEKENSRREAEVKISKFLTKAQQIDFSFLVNFLEEETYYIVNEYPNIFNSFCKKNIKKSSYIPKTSKDFIEAISTLNKAKIEDTGVVRAKQEDEIYLRYLQFNHLDDINRYVLNICQLRALLQTIFSFQVRATSLILEITNYDINQLDSTKNIMSEVLTSLRNIINNEILQLKKNFIFLQRHKELKPPPYLFIVSTALLLCSIGIIIITLLFLGGIFPNIFVNFSLIEQVFSILTSIIIPTVFFTAISVGLNKLGRCIYEKWLYNKYYANLDIDSPSTSANSSHESSTPDSSQTPESSTPDNSGTPHSSNSPTTSSPTHSPQNSRPSSPPPELQNDQFINRDNYQFNGFNTVVLKATNFSHEISTPDHSVTPDSSNSLANSPITQSRKNSNPSSPPHELADEQFINRDNCQFNGFNTVAL